MTAEIAILNKTAVALAADSAVTVSAGSKHEKIFDSADKLFELSSINPIGVMIYNGTSFAEAPLPALICDFRELGLRFETVNDAAVKFLAFLAEFGRQSPQEVLDAQLVALVEPVLKQIVSRVVSRLEEVMASSGGQPKLKSLLADLVDGQIADLEKVLSQRQPAEFVGGNHLRFTARQTELLRAGIQSTVRVATPGQIERLVRALKLVLKKDLPAENRTGIVVAGFGSSEKFPTLVSFEIDGMVCGRLKCLRTNYIDIDRRGPRAGVIPFAQKEMVERFLYGLDDKIQESIADFSQRTLPTISEKVFELVELPNDKSRDNIKSGLKLAERAFLTGLERSAFKKIKDDFREEIEDMVEFMPKPELAKMAEALVNLTSIKRRVSRGMETVGGPIDVALISRSEGFIWVKRKHYFRAELNQRYFSRAR